MHSFRSARATSGAELSSDRACDAVIDLEDLVGLYRRRDADRVALRQQDLSLAERVVRTGVAQHVISARLPVLVAELVEAASDDVAARRSTDLEQQVNADLRVVEAVERCKAVLDAVGLEALARLQGDIESSEQLRSVDLGRREAPGWLDAAELTAMEVTTATGLGTHDIHSRLGLATCRTVIARELRSRLQSGALSLHRACTIHAETRRLPDDVGLEIIDTVLREKDGAPPSPSLFRQRLSRACLAADREAGERRREARRRRRGAFALIEPDGLGALHVTNDADKIIGAMERVDAIARAARNGGDSRDLDSLRADVITDILMFGWPSTAEMPASHDDSVPSETTGPVPAERAAGEAEAAGEARVSGEAVAPVGPAGDAAATGESRVAGEATAPQATAGGAGAAAGPATAARANRPAGRFDQPRVVEDWFTRLGQRPAAKVCIVVPFTTAVGVTDGPCEVPGYGWVVADHARKIILNSGSTWHRLSVDAETGAAVRLETTSYRPTAAMRAHVEAVDGTCRAPGCTVPAARCDLDHDIPWPHGPTDVANLTSKHRQHHNAHTHGHWRVDRDSEGLVRWRTKAGRTYETRPKDWLDGVREQTTRQAVVVPLADDPPPF
ncbi:HNH endonuclease signature motif containing protein [Humibacillus xanthopallidus]|uniref:HNH endonuclease signature motif containing protein n=1 Tax=Humibacillus xanthopallidus TaxID=412689 RepID=UPI00163AE589|nr:HNH endonuclease signature motif containing protein [Humibacillus xanthopallidus]